MRSVETKIIVGFALAFVMLAAIGFTSHSSMDTLVSTLGEVSHTHAVVENLEGLICQVNAAENAARGYALTRDESFIETHQQAVADIDTHLRNLRRTMAHDPDQEDRLQGMESLVAAKIAWTRSVIDTTRVAGSAAAIPLVTPHGGMELLHGVQHLADVIATDESGVYAANEALARQSVRKAFALIYFGTCFALFVIIVALLIIHGDMNGRRKAEAALRESEQELQATLEDTKRLQSFLDSIIENLPHMVFVKDARDLRFVRFNRAGEELLGYRRDELIGRNDYDFFPKEEADFFTAKDRMTLENGGIVDVSEEPIATRGRGNRILHTKKVPISDGEGRPRYLLGISEDITERKQAEARIALLNERLRAMTEAEERARREQLQAQFLQAQKMEAVGRLAGGVAHDFNNLLHVISGYSELALARADRVEKVHDYIEQIRAAAQRAAGLTRQLLAFSRRETMEPRILDLNGVINEMEKMLHRLIGEDVRLETDPGADLGRVKADPGQIEQILMNLVINARDAMPQGGRIVIATQNGVMPGEASGDGRGAVVLSVTDTGSGMDAATRARIFEPFFTTKDEGKGTGLGLATVDSLLRHMGGSVEVESAPGQGTTFRLYFPREDLPVSVAAPEAITVAGGTETILVVEDDLAVREMMVDGLAAWGYMVFTAADCAQAEKIAREHSGPIDLVITDLILPGPGGREVGERIAALRPGTRILYMSGYIDDTIARNGIAGGHLAFLPKPFSLPVLARRVREMLEFETQGDQAVDPCRHPGFSSAEAAPRLLEEAA